jgi:hypothetical protein
LDVHHKDGEGKLLPQSSFNIDDRTINLEVVERQAHSILHYAHGDLGFVDM